MGKRFAEAEVVILFVRDRADPAAYLGGPTWLVRCVTDLGRLELVGDAVPTDPRGHVGPRAATAGPAAVQLVLGVVAVAFTLARHTRTGTRTDRPADLGSRHDRICPLVRVRARNRRPRVHRVNGRGSLRPSARWGTWSLAVRTFPEGGHGGGI